MALKTIEQFRAEATTEVEASKPKKVVVDGVEREYTDDEYDQAIEDLAQHKLNAQNNGYKEARREGYPSLGDQLDLLFHDMTANKGDKTGEWYKAVKAVKDANPKPS